ncbi:hypothetical protein E2I00_005732, partial [Balaenoptera physalus]
ASPGPTTGAAKHLEFAAKKELVPIIPNFSLDKIYLTGSDLGPFRPGSPVQMPLWRAINPNPRRVGCFLPMRQRVTRTKLDNLTLMEVNTPGLSSHQLHYGHKLRTHLQPSEGAQSQDFEGETGLSRPLSEAGGSRVALARNCHA